MSAPSSGAIPSPNIWNAPDVYEIENLAVDRAGAIETSMRSIRDWQDADVVDIGCGTGFHLPHFAATARSVTGVEPHSPLATRALQRVAGLAQVQVIEAGAASIPVPNKSFDVMHARWAYFFGAGCEPGLLELDRVMRPGSAAFVIDNDATRSTFGSWFRQAMPAYDAAAVERFWHRHGWQRECLDITWEFDSRTDFEAVVAIEFDPAMAGRILADHPDMRQVDYAVNLWWRRW